MKEKSSVFAFLRSITIQTRLYVVLVLVAIPLLGFGISLMYEQWTLISIMESERRTMELISPVRKLQSDLATHRGAINHFLSVGDEASKAKIDQAAKEVEKDLAAMEEINENASNEADAREHIEPLKKAWNDIKVTGLQTTAEKNVIAHRVMLEENDHLMRQLGNYIMMNDPDPAVSYMVQSVVIDLPALLDVITTMRRFGREIAGQERATEGQILVSKEKIVDLAHFGGLFLHGLEEAELDEDLASKLKAGQGAVVSFRVFFEKNLMNTEAVTVSKDEVNSKATEAFQAADNIGIALVERVDEMLVRNLRAAQIQLATVGAIVIGSLIVTLLLVGYIGRSITLPLQDTVDRVKDIGEGEGDLTQRLRVEGKDEVGLLGNNLNQFIGTLDTMIGKVYFVSSSLAKYSTELALASQGLSSGSEEVATQSQMIASASTQMNTNLQVLSSAIEEMSISIAEVAKKSSEAATVARDANNTAQKTGQIVGILGENAEEIGQVIETIASIASQTNLLALNAAIEAAGAGEAGKGFAVVASEVKELARQAGDASEEIKSKITAIRTSAQEVTEAMKIIMEINGRVNEINSTIASSVEEQAITAKEVASNISQSSKAANDVTSNIGGISQAVSSSVSDAEKASGLAKDLEKMSQDLSGIVSKFKFTSVK